MLSRLGGSPDGVGLAEVNYYPNFFTSTIEFERAVFQDWT
jgi:hypothetical protein